MALAVHRLRQFIKACDPLLPLNPGDSAYVELDQGVPVRGSGGAACIDALQATVDLSEPTEATCQLFSGFSGSGKTTELRRLKVRFEEDRTTATHVTFVNADEYIDPYTPITITDVLRVLAHALDQAAAEQEAAATGEPVDPSKGYVRRFFDFLTQTDVALKNVGFDTYGAKLMLELKENPAFRERAEKALSLRFQQFASEAREVMDAAVVRLRKATGAQRVVLIVDGLEKLSTIREEDRIKVEASVETVFVQQASWLRPPCHAIFTFPLWLRFRAPLGGMYDREPQVLPMVKIAEHDAARTDFRPGVDKLVELVARRIAVDEVFADRAQVEALVRASGGYPKDLLRLVREVLYTSKAFPVTATDVQRVVDRLAEAYAQTVRGPAFGILTEIAETHAIPSGDSAVVAAFGRLLEQWLVLAYRNGGEWYDVHPLVRKKLAAT